MSALRIARATQEHVDAIRALTRAAYAKWVAVIGREPLPKVADYATAVTEHAIDLLFDSETLVALVLYVEHDNDIYIDNLAVLPTQQKRGLGTFLLRHVEALARQRGKSRLTLLTNIKFAGNVAFYQKRGFAIDRIEPFKGDHTVYMGKKLLPQVRLAVLPDVYGVCCLASNSALPQWAEGEGFVSISRADDELSIVCPAARIPAGVEADGGWRCLKLLGPFDFNETGIVLSVVGPLSNNGLGVFVVSTFKGDHLLVKAEQFDAAYQHLQQNGHVIIS